MCQTKTQSITYIHNTLVKEHDNAKIMEKENLVQRKVPSLEVFKCSPKPSDFILIDVSNTFVILDSLIFVH